MLWVQDATMQATDSSPFGASWAVEEKKNQPASDGGVYIRWGWRRMKGNEVREALQGRVSMAMVRRLDAGF